MLNANAKGVAKAADKNDLILLMCKFNYTYSSLDPPEIYLASKPAVAAVAAAAPPTHQTATLTPQSEELPSKRLLLLQRLLKLRQLLKEQLYCVANDSANGKSPSRKSNQTKCCRWSQTLQNARQLKRMLPCVSLQATSRIARSF